MEKEREVESAGLKGGEKEGWQFKKGGQGRLIKKVTV